MKPQDCPSLDNCDAPLCPLGESVGWLKDAAWFPGEAICRKEHRHERWIAVQKRIDKVTGGDRKRGFFTVRMLDALTAVTPAIYGIDVDTKDEAADVEAWCAKRRRCREPTPEEAERRREHGRRRALELNRGRHRHCVQDETGSLLNGIGPENATCSKGMEGQTQGALAKDSLSARHFNKEGAT